MSFSGAWNITVDSPMGKQNTKLEVQVEGDTLVGTQSGNAGSNPIANGKVDGDTATWQTAVSSPFPVTLEFTGVMAGDSVSGKVKAGNFGSFNFSGTRA